MFTVIKIFNMFLCLSGSISNLTYVSPFQWCILA